jgi:hypothetical protein
VTPMKTSVISLAFGEVNACLKSSISEGALTIGPPIHHGNSFSVLYSRHVLSVHCDVVSVKSSDSKYVVLDIDVQMWPPTGILLRAASHLNVVNLFSKIPLWLNAIEGNRIFIDVSKAMPWIPNIWIDRAVSGSDGHTLDIHFILHKEG